MTVNLNCNLRLPVYFNRKNIALESRRTKLNSTKATLCSTTTSQREPSRTCSTKKSTRTSKTTSSSTSEESPTTCLSVTACSRTSLKREIWLPLRTSLTSCDKVQRKSSARPLTSKGTQPWTKCKLTTRVTTRRTCSQACCPNSKSRRGPTTSTPRSATSTTSKSGSDLDKHRSLQSRARSIAE